ncbi:MAG: glycosyltransferase family 39 protein, partial [Lachnospiraceae bacterium]|nr:glycosyltransferase family 39 protein [Lachnospiraceae bacterium]
YYQFYQPPLHYFLSAVWVKISALLGVASEEWDEALQLLSVLYGTLVLVFLNLLGKRLDCSVTGRFVVVGLAAFFPYSVFMGGALNNDPLVTLLMLMSLYFTVKWYQEPGMKNILLMALCVGGAMMTKLSGALVAFGMAVVMLWKPVSCQREWRRYVKQFVCFGLVSFPLGLWYSVLRYVQYGMPFGFVPALPEESTQFIGQYTKWERFQDYAYALESLSVRWGGEEGLDYNIPVTLIKFGVFDELNYYGSNAATFQLGRIVFWATVVLFLLFAATFLVWLPMKGSPWVFKALLGVSAAAILAAYVHFCWAYPQVCTMNIRYVMTAVYIGMLAIGMAVSGGERRLLAAGQTGAGRLLRILTVTSSAGYMICCALLLTNLELLLH